MTARTRLSAAAFEALRPRLARLALGSVDIAREILVDGRHVPDVAAARGLSRQRIYGILRRFDAAADSVPTDWQRVEVWVPPELAAEIVAKAAQARQDLNSKAKDSEQHL